MSSEKMFAAVYLKFNSKELTVREIPKPKPNANQILVKVKAAAWNPVDCKLKLNAIPGYTIFGNATVGKDFSGVIQEIGSNAQGKEQGPCSTEPRLKVGDQVMGYVSGSRAMAEYVVMSKDQITKKPENMSFEQAAGTCLVSITAYDGLYANTVKNRPKISKGQQILILGSSSGVGIVAVQLAKNLGAHVTGVCSKKNFEFCKSIGCDELIDYTDTEKNGLFLKKYGTDLKNEFENEKNGIKNGANTAFDMIYDTVSSGEPNDPNYYENLKLLTKNYVSINGLKSQWGKAILSNMLKKDVQTANYDLYLPFSTSTKLDEITKLVSNEKLKIFIEKTFKFTEGDLNLAHDLQMSRRARGKIIVKIEERG